MSCKLYEVVSVVHDWPEFFRGKPEVYYLRDGVTITWYMDVHESRRFLRRVSHLLVGGDDFNTKILRDASRRGIYVGNTNIIECLCRRFNEEEAVKLAEYLSNWPQLDTKIIEIRSPFSVYELLAANSHRQSECEFYVETGKYTVETNYVVRKEICLPSWDMIISGKVVPQDMQEDLEPVSFKGEYLVRESEHMDQRYQRYYVITEKSGHLPVGSDLGSLISKPLTRKHDISVHRCVSCHEIGHPLDHGYYLDPDDETKKFYVCENCFETYHGDIAEILKKPEQPEDSYHLEYQGYDVVFV